MDDCELNGFVYFMKIGGMKKKFEWVEVVLNNMERAKIREGVCLLCVCIVFIKK